MFGGDSQHGRQAFFDIGIFCCPRRDADPHRGVSLPDCPSAPTCAVSLQFCDNLLCSVRIAERD